MCMLMCESVSMCVCTQCVWTRVCTHESMQMDECVCEHTLMSVWLCRDVYVCAGVPVYIPNKKAKWSKGLDLPLFVIFKQRVNILSWAKTWCSRSRSICKINIPGETGIVSLVIEHLLCTVCIRWVVSGQFSLHSVDWEHFAPWWGACPWCHIPSTCFVSTAPNERKMSVSTTWNQSPHPDCYSIWILWVILILFLNLSESIFPFHQELLGKLCNAFNLHVFFLWKAVLWFSFWY